MIDSALWLSPLDGENPSGADLRNDPRFHELERLAEPSVKVVYDERNRPSSQVSTPPDWTAILEKAEEMRASGRDLRLLVIVTRALANEDGLAGLAKGLSLVAETIETYWDSLHPALRGGGPVRDAALRRINALLDLQNAQDGLLADLRRLTLLAPRVTGPISGQDLEQGALDDRAMLAEAASGLNDKERAVLSAAHEQLLSRVRTACLAQLDQNGDELLALIADARAAAEALDRIDRALNARLGEEGVAVPMLKRFLERVLTTLERGSAGKVNGAAEPADAVTAAAPLPNGHAGEAPPARAAPSAGLPVSISSREDVVKCLDLVVAFYDRTEPSSPIPHLARRVRRMVHMDFIELMEDLAPSGLKEFRLLAGVSDPKKGAQKE
ncbi:MAG: type VI secretion system protein TssA [Rhizobiales bacterium]|nr:type VI secretion system protein TssA [Hyphomicrobiales bacterium]